MSKNIIKILKYVVSCHKKCSSKNTVQFCLEGATAVVQGSAKKISFKTAIKKSILIDNMISEMSKQIRFQNSSTGTIKITMNDETISTK
jgi:hypothetical protein